MMYNLDVVIAVGYRVNSYEAIIQILFRHLRPKLTFWRFYELNFRFYTLKIHLKNTKFDGFHSTSGTSTRCKCYFHTVKVPLLPSTRGGSTPVLQR